MAAREPQLCPGCFTVPASAAPCRVCGFDPKAERPPNVLALGTLLHDQFEIGRILGKPGGFGITYLGFHHHLATTVAIKEYLPRDWATRHGDGSTVIPHTGEDREAFDYGLEQFLNEARVLARLDHPNIVRVRDFFRANGSAYLVMDYYRGLSLAEHLDRQPGGRLPEAQALALMQPILDGLRAVHAKDFLHRDIKPANIYLAQTEQGGVRPILLDFGAARQAAGERSRSISVLISEGYAPLEQYSRRGRQGPATDIYAAGAVLYRMLTGEAPPPATERITGEPLRPASDFGISQAVSRALDHALAMDASARPRQVTELQAELSAAPPPPPPGSAEPRPAATAQPAPREQPRAMPARPAVQRSKAEPKHMPEHRSGLLLGIMVGVSALVALVAGIAYLATGETARPSATPIKPDYDALLAERSGETSRSTEATESSGQSLMPSSPRHVPTAITPEPVPAAKPWPAGTHGADEPEMVRIPAGSFLMGCQPGEESCDDDEKPAHPVSLAAFSLGRTEVTFAQWDACVADGGCVHRPGDQGWGRAARPVINVSFEDTQAYVTWLSRKTGKPYRLPSEAEWEYAARAGTTTAFSTGNCITTSQANYYGNAYYNGCGAKTGVSVGRTQPVGSYPKNPWGLLDMHGNVWEWTADCWNDSYAGAPADGSSWRHGNCGWRVVRGGSWYYSPRFLRSALRYGYDTGVRSSNLGFRVARTLTP